MLLLWLSVLEITQTEPWESIQDKRELLVLWVERFKGKHQKSGVYTSQPECTETGTIMWTLLVCLVNLHSQRLPESHIITLPSRRQPSLKIGSFFVCLFVCLFVFGGGGLRSL